ncbi:unnamed protein product [Blepharisma stoltei]|uniref:Man1/Src1 C-terminal domain-containing protein n=1 Tax=Blepharisma stoltei TaxID=1481888 RepID=A0AAU9JWF4_9CILI|nr:unnamed protein product [Blepharisma stoltei]
MEDFQDMTILQIRKRLNELNAFVPSSVTRKQDLIDKLVEAIQKQQQPERNPPKRSVSPISSFQRQKTEPAFSRNSIPQAQAVSPPRRVGAIPYNPSSIKLSNQKTDVFRQRMEAAFPSEEKESLEVKSSSATLIKESLSQIGTFIGILLAILFAAYLVKVYMAKPIFCGEGIYENCIKCPEHAICKGGSMSCEPGFERDRTACVEDEKVKKKAYTRLWELESYVISQATHKWLETRTEFMIDFEDYSRQFLETEEGLIVSRLKELIKAKVSLKIDSLDDPLKLIIHAKKPFLGLYAQIIEFLQDHKYSLTIGLLISLFFIYKYICYRQRKVLLQQARKMYEMISSQIKANVDDTLEHGVMESTIKSDIENQLGKSLTRKLWPIIEELRRKDKNVCKFEMIVSGRPRILWQWKEEVKPVIGNKMKYF